MILYGRSWRVTLANPDASGVDREARLITGLRVRFKIERNLLHHPNKSEVTITNLNADSRAKIKDARAAGSGGRPTLVTVEAGYGSDLHVVGRGDVRTIAHVRAGADWESKIQLGDGEYNYRSAQSNISFGKGTTSLAIIERLIADLGLGRGNFDQVKRDAGLVHIPVLGSYSRGYSFTGWTAQELKRMLADHGYEYSVQNGVLQILRDGAALPNPNQGFVLSAKTGLVGSPEYCEFDPKRGSYLKVKSLLLPLAPGYELELDAEKTKGPVRIEKLTVTGDSHGKDWYDEAECSRL